ncbi:nucleoside monophosphate kinase [Candidatus Gribaldobacteria bacterium]|nr:nucleoside monophosphate kinase [Candidatus Gribaldobacteria bacterium]
MKNIEFPLFKTKAENVKERFNLTDPQEREAYFQLKAGLEIRKLQEYLKENSFICYLLGKKNSGKGTYAKMLKEVVDKDKIEHFSIGDMVRTLDEVVGDKEKLAELENFLSKNYRGYLPLKDIVEALKSRSTKILLPSELILALVKMKISTDNKKALFIDGFPRNLDQVSYSLFFRDLIGYRDDPDVFILIDVPEKVIDERIKYRVVCPKCQTSRNLKLLPTKYIGFDQAKKEYFLLCDNPECSNEIRLQGKEGDELGIEPIRDRLETDEELMKKTFALYGVPKVLLRNSVPVEKAKEYLDDYEITPEFNYQQNGNEIIIKEKPWLIQDDQGIDSYSLMPPPVVVSLIKQLVEVLGL